MEPSASKVFTTHAKDSRTEPTATTFTNAFARRRPRTPFTRNPSSGNAGMSQRCCMLILHRVHFVHIERASILEHCKDDRQAHCRFSRGHHHHKEREQVTVRFLELIGE